MTELLWSIAIFLAITGIAYSYFRFALIDPQFPEPSSVWSLLFKAFSSTALCVVAYNNPVIGPLAAAVAISMVITPAIAPSINVSKDEEPNFFARLYAKVALSVGNAIWKSAIIALALWFFAGDQVSLLGQEYPTWYLVFGTVGGFLLLSRPISQPIDANQVERTHIPIDNIDISPTAVKQRIVSVFCYGLWLTATLPLLQTSFNPTQGFLELLGPAVVGFIATQAS